MVQYGVDNTQGVLLANTAFLAEPGKDHTEIGEEMAGIIAARDPFPERLVWLQIGKNRRLESGRFGRFQRQQ